VIAEQIHRGFDTGDPVVSGGIFAELAGEEIQFPRLLMIPGFIKFVQPAA
jgi:hypothetical protein